MAGVWIPALLLEDPAVVPLQRFLYLVLREHTNPSGELLITIEQAGKIVGWKERNTQLNMSHLKQRGHLAIERNNRGWIELVKFPHEGANEGAKNGSYRTGAHGKLCTAVPLETKAKANTGHRDIARARGAGEEVDQIQPLFAVERETNPNPDPNYSPEALMVRWTKGGLPLARSTAPAMHLDALRRLHHEPPFWSREEVERGIDRLIADTKGARAMSWAWNQGPVYLVRKKNSEDRQGLEKVLTFEQDDLPARASNKKPTTARAAVGQQKEYPRDGSAY